MKDKIDAANGQPRGTDGGSVSGRHGFAGGGHGFADGRSDGRRLPADGTGAGASGPR